jgi:hypothetical protein
MKFLFNSKGEHIANFTNKQLYSPSGRNIGHFLEVEGIFIDMNGHYLGEIIYDNRLLYNKNNNHKNNNYGSYGNYGNIGSYGNPGNYGSIGLISGYCDIESLKLGSV